MVVNDMQERQHWLPYFWKYTHTCPNLIFLCKSQTERWGDSSNRVTSGITKCTQYLQSQLHQQRKNGVHMLFFVLCFTPPLYRASISCLGKFSSSVHVMCPYILFLDPSFMAYLCLSRFFWDRTYYFVCSLRLTGETDYVCVLRCLVRFSIFSAILKQGKLST